MKQPVKQHSTFKDNPSNRKNVSSHTKGNSVEPVGGTSLRKSVPDSFVRAQAPNKRSGEREEQSQFCSDFQEIPLLAQEAFPWELNNSVSFFENLGSGVNPSNTPPPSSHSYKTVGSEDWFEINFYVDWDHKWDAVYQMLSLCKEWAAEENQTTHSSCFKVEGVGEVEVNRTGARLGSGRKGPFMEFQLHIDDGLTVLIMKRSKAHETMPNVVVRADGEYCLYHGAATAFKQGKTLLKILGGYIKKNKLSRVDMALDMPGFSIAPFYDAFIEKRAICGSKGRDFHLSSGITLGFGTPLLSCRIYDKLQEVITKANPWRAVHMRVLRWGGMVPDSAVRVEFQIRRDALKKRSVDTVEDYFLIRSDLIEYLTFKWLRLVKDKIDRKNKNQSRAKTLPEWEQVQEGFCLWAGSPAGLPLAPIPKGEADVSQMIKQSFGTIASAARYKGKILSTWDDVKAFLDSEMKHVAEKKLEETALPSFIVESGTIEKTAL